MAFNEDLRWEDHRPICRTEEVVEDLGIEAEEAGNWRYWIVSMALSAVFLIAMFVGPTALHSRFALCRVESSFGSRTNRSTGSRGTTEVDSGG